MTYDLEDFAIWLATQNINLEEWNWQKTINKCRQRTPAAFDIIFTNLLKATKSSKLNQTACYYAKKWKYQLDQEKIGMKCKNCRIERWVDTEGFCSPDCKNINKIKQLKTQIANLQEALVEEEKHRQRNYESAREGELRVKEISEEIKLIQKSELSRELD